MSLQIEGIRLVAVLYKRGEPNSFSAWMPVAERYTTIQSVNGFISKESAISSCKDAVDKLLTTTYETAEQSAKEGQP